VSLFSFGPAKPATALGGAMLSFRDAAMRDRVRDHQARWPLQSRTAYAMRLMKYLLLIPLAHPWVFGALSLLCRWLGASHERLVAGIARGFSHGEFFERIRRRPCGPLLRLIQRRIAQGVQASALQRARRSRQLQGLLGECCIGEAAHTHQHWLFPITHDDPQGLVRRLAARGFDATHHASSLDVLPAPAGALPTPEATRTFAGLVYLPAHEGMSEDDIVRLAAAVVAFVPRVRNAARPSLA
jgi:hypothetical protein